MLTPQFTHYLRAHGCNLRAGVAYTVLTRTRFLLTRGPYCPSLLKNEQQGFERGFCEADRDRFNSHCEERISVTLADSSSVWPAQDVCVYASMHVCMYTRMLHPWSSHDGMKAYHEHVGSRKLHGWHGWHDDSYHLGNGSTTYAERPPGGNQCEEAT